MSKITGLEDCMEAVSDYLKALWREVLRVDEVPVYESFFSLGGDSMLAIRMLVAVTSKVGRDLDYDRFFASPNIATLSQLMMQGNANEADSLQ